MPDVFEKDGEVWIPSDYARGPRGLQGGAVSALMAAEVEALAAEQDLGAAVSITAWFLRPTPHKPLRGAPRITARAGRASVFDNALTPEGEDTPCALARVTVIRPRPIDAPPFETHVVDTAFDPAAHPLRPIPRGFGDPWFMDVTEVRYGGDGRFWFKPLMEIASGGGPLSRVVGPADWSHGLVRPLPNTFIDPNVTLTVELYRPPRGDWIGLEPQARWDRDQGTGAGRAVLKDVHGDLGSVSMAVALLRMPSPE